VRRTFSVSAFISSSVYVSRGGNGLPGPGCTSSHQPWYAPQKRTRYFFRV